MKEIYFRLKHKIGNYFYIALFANFILAQGESSTYFDKTIAYFKVQKNILDPFYKNIDNLSLSSFNYNQSYAGINPTNKLNKLKIETKPGANSTFVITEQFDNNDLYVPSVVDVDYYIQNQINLVNKESFKQQIRNDYSNNNSRNNFNNKSINILNRNIGETNIMIDLKGSIEINGELEFTDQEGGNLARQGDKWNLDVNQKQQFDLEGNVGDRLKVSADQNSESDFDFENSLLLEYKGFDNEIINKISAGNISLSLPHTQLVSVGMGKREGLFGVKMESNFGGLNLSTIVGREKVKKESFSLGDQASGLTKYDYQFVRDKYFFVDDIFKVFHYPLSEDHKNILNTHYVIKDFELFKRSKSNEIVPGTYIGEAYLDPNDLNSHVEPGYWIKLEDQNQGNDYSIDPFTGIIRLNTVSSTDVVAAHYTIGVFSNGSITDVGPEYNTTGTDVSPIATQNDQCVNQIHYCDEDNPLFETLVACTDDILDYSSVCEDFNGDVIDFIDSASDCVSQKYIDDGCYIYNPDTQQYDLFNSVYLNSTDCNSINFFNWGPPCDYINNDCLEDEYDLSCEEFSSNKLILKLIKTSEPQNSTSKTWDLMLKNIYSLGTNRINREDLPEVEIIHVGGQLGTETASSTGKTFLNIFGLDNLDVNGDIVDGGDGRVDGASLNIINEYGDLVFPYHMPFAYDEGLSIYDNETSNIVHGFQRDDLYWGNNNSDLNGIFDGELKSFNTETKSLTIDILNSSNVIVPYTFSYSYYNNGPAMYYSDSQNEFTAQREFAIKIENVNQNTTINLGFMIVEGSETLTDGNSVLIPNIDYRVDYFSGTLTLISDKAKNSAETLTISYDRNEIVSFDQKLIFGNYFKYDFSSNSNLFGGAYVYKQDIADKKVDIGYEPMENFMWHLGGTYKKDFDLLNERINNNTRLNLEKPSKLQLLTEYAEVNPNPNPLGVAYLDDFESSSIYTSIFENFSSWKLSSPPLLDDLSGNLYDKRDRMKLFWFNPYQDISTIDIWENVEAEANATESTLWLEIPDCQDQENYYNCPESLNDVWWSGITTHLISSEYNQKDKKYLDIWLNTNGQNGYAGLNQSLNQDNNMILNIDLGEISEDINLNGKADSEDSPMYGVQLGNGTLEDNGSEDVGIDACTNEYEDGWGGCLCLQYSHYIEVNDENISSPYNSCNDSNAKSFQSVKSDILSGFESDLSKINIDANFSDPNGDDFYFVYSSTNPSYTSFNGTQGNYQESLIINKEDFDGDDYLDNTNSYFTYSIDLSKNFSNGLNPNEDIKAGETSSGWVLYRIPLSKFSIVKETESSEDPTWELIKNVRLWISATGSNNFGKIGIASIDLVGNDWENLGVAYSDQLLESGYDEAEYNYDDNLLNTNENIFLQVVNTHENDYYIPPPNVAVNTTQSTLDFNNLIKEKEQSLVMSFEDECNQNQDDCGLGANETAFIKKNFGFSSLDAEKQNSFFAYENIEMYYKAINESNYKFDSTKWVQNDICNGDEVEIAFRIGKDNNYYEIRQKLDNNCTEDMSPLECEESWNNLNINLEELTRYKQFRDGLDYSEHGLDGCSDDYETGLYEVYNNLVLPTCLSQEDIDNNFTFTKICNELDILNCNTLDETNTEECIILSSKINEDFCDIEEEYVLYDSINKHYRPNKNDPNGDNFQIPNQDCCLLNDLDCYIDNNICDAIPRNNIDCLENSDLDDSCSSLPLCPDPLNDFNDINSSLYDIINVNDYSSLFYRGTENNYSYDCYFYNEESWNTCNSYSEEEIYNYSLNTIYNENMNLVGELIFDSNGVYVHNDVPPSQNEQYNIWIWNQDNITSDRNLEEVCGECTSLSIKGEPAINRIEYVMVGVVNDTSAPIYGSVWLNELRMSGVKKDKGTALLANMQFNLGDLFDIDLSYSQQEANYHKLEKRISAGNSKVNYSTSMSFKPHKLLSEDYFEMPLNFKYTKNLSSPMYKTGTDIYLGTNINSAPEFERSENNKINFSTHIKTNLSKYFNNNLLLSYILDKGRISYSYSRDNSSSPTIFNKLVLSERIDYSYNLTYSKNNYWQPFKNLLEKESMKYDDEDVFVSFLKEFKIFYTPKDIQFNASYTDNSNFSEQRSSFGGSIIDEQNINLHRTFKVSYSLLENLLVNYNIDMRNNLNDYSKNLNLSKLFDFSFSPGIAKTKSEKFTFTFNPDVLDWLSPRFMYNPRYSWNRDLNTSGDATADVKSENDFTASFTLSFQKLIEKFYQTENKSTGNSRGRSSRGRKSSTQKNNTQNFNIDQPHFKSILEFMHDVSKKISSISISYKYSKKNNYSNIIADFNPSYSFKLGLVDDPFNENSFENYITDSGSVYTFSNNFYQELRLNTTFQVTNNLSISNLEYKISLSANNQSTTGYNETKVYSYFPVGATGIDGIPIFNWSINYRGLEKFWFLDNFFKTITLNHNYSGERTETFADNQVQKIDYRRSFAPLIGIKIIPKNSPLNINLNFNNTLNINNTGEQTERKTSDQINIKLDYRKDGGFQIPIFFLRDFEIENKINLSLTMGYDKSQTDFSYVYTDKLSDFETTAFSKTYNLKPELTYSFSKFIDGNFYFNYSISETHTTGRKKQTDLGFRIKIIFESFN